GRVALRWHDGRSLRLDEGTELVLLEAHRIELRRGALYLDSAEALAGGGPEIATIHGRFRAIGTQFEVRLDRAPESGVRLRVRRGAVELRAGKLRDAVAAGAELHLGADGRARRAAVATHGAAWAWVLEAAPVPDVDGWTLARFLAWYGRESGLEIAYADAASAALATEVVLHGATARLRPAEALAAAAASAGFETRAEGGRLVAVSSSAAP
ncbi:MAG: FecR family protein, partial [Thermoanaerobaculia bacterium]|nr:FecR family protein [Thermoanaerobaculia bacterium]